MRGAAGRRWECARGNGGPNKCRDKRCSPGAAPAPQHRRAGRGGAEGAPTRATDAEPPGRAEVRPGPGLGPAPVLPIRPRPRVLGQVPATRSRPTRLRSRRRSRVLPGPAAARRSRPPLTLPDRVPAPQAPAPSGALPASSSGTSCRCCRSAAAATATAAAAAPAAAAAACAKLGFPEAALAAGRAPPRPRRICRSPCRQTAISDRRLRNLPKCARPEMAEAVWASPREGAGTFGALPTAPEGRCRALGVEAAGLARGIVGGAGLCGREGDLGAGRGGSCK